MRGETIAWKLGAAAIVLLATAACGGRILDATTGDGGSNATDGNNGGNGNSGTGSSSADIGATCTQTMGGASGNGDTCEVSSAGTCSDGEDYDLDCSCPAGTCTCTKGTTSSGTVTSQVSIACSQMCSSGGMLLAVQACNFASGQGTVTPLDAGLTACTIPATMQPPSQFSAWSVARALLVCNGGGTNTICMSDDGTECPNDPVTVGSCTDECAANEYAVTFGGMPFEDAGLLPQLLAGCSGGLHYPSGVVLECCPCQ